jgi:hypothetical protein
MFDVVNVLLVQMSGNHGHVCLMKDPSIIFQGLAIQKNEIFFLVKSCVLQRKKFILLSFCILNHSLVLNDKDIHCFSDNGNAFT